MNAVELRYNTSVKVLSYIPRLLEIIVAQSGMLENKFVCLSGISVVEKQMTCESE